MKQFPAFPPSMPSIAPVTAAQVVTKLASTKALMLGVVGTLAVGAALAQPASDRVTWLMPEIDAAVSVPTPGGSGASPAAPVAAVPSRLGLGQPVADYLIAHWGTRAKHEVLIANVKRSWRMVEAGERACHLGVLRTPERETVAYFIDTHLVPPHQLIVRRAALPKLARNAAGDVELERVWSARQLRGAVVAGRSYGRAIDALLAKRPPGVVDAYTTPDFGGNMLSMIAIGRADYTIEYDFVLAAQQELRANAANATSSARAGPISMADLVSVPIDGLSEPVVSGIACPRTPWGRRTIEHIERVLGSATGRQFLRDEFLSHLSVDAKARYGARVDAFYAKPLNVSPR